ARLARPGRRPCLLRPSRGACAHARRLCADGVRRGRPRSGRSAPSACAPRQRGVLDRTWLCAPTGHHDAAGLGRAWRGAMQPRAHVLDPAAGGRGMRIAAAKYPVAAPASFADFGDRQRRLLEGVAARGARIALLPEYLSLELGAGFDAAVAGDLAATLAAIQRHREDWLALYSGIARATGMLVVAGSSLLDVGGGRYRNRCNLFTPAKGHAWQDKLQLTGFEKQAGTIERGDALKVFEHDGLRLAVAVCYDSEFPLPVRAQYEAGARLLLVPSCTDTAAGATRVRVGCLARALENRCFVAHSVTAGAAPWSPALDANTGEA